MSLAMVVVEEDKFVDVQEGFTRLIAGCRSMVANRNVVGAMEPQGIGLRENRLMQAPITPRDQHIAQEGFVRRPHKGMVGNSLDDVAVLTIVVNRDVVACSR
jgi:hypothetical protein